VTLRLRVPIAFALLLLGELLEALRLVAVPASDDADRERPADEHGGHEDHLDELVTRTRLQGMGFAPRPEGYGLENTGVATTDRGAIAIDDYMRTNVEGIYAIGDCTGMMMLAYTAEAQGVVAVETIAGAETMPINHDMNPRPTYCQPQVASFGYSEAPAKDKG